MLSRRGILMRNLGNLDSGTRRVRRWAAGPDTGTMMAFEV